MIPSLLISVLLVADYRVVANGGAMKWGTGPDDVGSIPSWSSASQLLQAEWTTLPASIFDEPGVRAFYEAGGNRQFGEVEPVAFPIVPPPQIPPRVPIVSPDVNDPADELFRTYYNPLGSQFAFGNRGAQPYKYDWLSYDDIVYIPSSPARGVAGSMQAVEWNTWMRYSRRIGEDKLFTWTPAFNDQFFSGPTGVAMPGDVNNLSSAVSLASVNPGPWNWQLGFNPQINSDFRRSLTSNAYIFDGHGVILYRASSTWTLAFGVALWDRTRERVIPYGGVIWTPNDRWEVRLLFPESRLSYYLGRRNDTDLWAYVTGEYVNRAYQVDIADTRAKDLVEMSDYRVMAGINGTWKGYTVFLQGGYVFDRHLQFRGPTPDFHLNGSALLRTGLTY